MDETYENEYPHSPQPRLSRQERLNAQLAAEQELALEIALELDERKRTRVKDEQPKEKKKLKRELQREALKRLEEAARTPDDFSNVLSHWERLDENAARRVRYHEIQRDEIPLEYRAKSNRGFYPAKYFQPRWRQVMRGNFIDVIHHCPYEIDETPTYARTAKYIKKLKLEQKELLFYLTVGQRSTAWVAAFFGQTDRNIRKKRATILKKLRKQIIAYTKHKMAINAPTTARERRLVEVFQDKPVDGYPYL